MISDNPYYLHPKMVTMTCPHCGGTSFHEMQEVVLDSPLIPISETEYKFGTPMAYTDSEANFVPDTYFIECDHCKKRFRTLKDLRHNEPLSLIPEKVETLSYENGEYIMFHHDDIDIYTPASPLGQRPLLAERRGIMRVQMKNPVETFRIIEYSTWNPDGYFEFFPYDKNAVERIACINKRGYERWNTYAELWEDYKDKPVRVAHIADSHLRDMQYNSYKRGEAFTTALENAVREAYYSGADAILMSGDMIDCSRPSAHVMFAVKKIHKLLVKLHMPMLHISGNHDDVAKRVPWEKKSWVGLFDTEWLDTDETVPVGIVDLTDSPARLTLDKGTLNAAYRINLTGGRSFTVMAWPWCDKEHFIGEMKIAEKYGAGKPRVDFLMWHGAVKEFCGFPAENMVTLDDIKQGLFKVVALGDIHVHESKTLPDGTVVAYPGSTCMCSHDEDPDKRFYLYTLYPDGKVEIESKPFEAAPIKSVTVTDTESLEQACELLRGAKDASSVIRVQLYPDVEENAAKRLSEAAGQGCAIYQCIQMPSEEDEVTVAAHADLSITLKQFTPDFVAKYTMDNTPALVSLCENLVDTELDPGESLQRASVKEQQ